MDDEFDDSTVANAINNSPFPEKKSEPKNMK